MVPGEQKGEGSRRRVPKIQIEVREPEGGGARQGDVLVWGTGR